MTDFKQTALEFFKDLVASGTPHAADLGFELVSLGDGEACLRVPYREDLVGDPETGVLHGGVVTALLDQVSGAAGFTGLGGDKAMATLDMRIDYMRPANPGQDVTAEARTIKVAGLIAFVEGLAHNGDRNDPIATSHAAFMVNKVSQDAAKKVADSVKSKGQAS